jgi:hypothetical protein
VNWDARVPVAWHRRSPATLTWIGATGMSALCQKRTHALQQEKRAMGVVSSAPNCHVGSPRPSARPISQAA